MSSERPGGWVEGIGWVALEGDLPTATMIAYYRHDADDVAKCVEADDFADHPVIVTRWADGTTPAPPNPDTDGGLHHSCLNPIVCAVCLRAAATPAPVTPPTEDECERCDGSGCDLNMCEDCGEEFTDPCARHRTFGHQPSPGGGYDDGSDCSTCCIDCHAPTPPETVPVPRAALDRLVDCHRFFCTSGTTPCCPAGEWIAAAGGPVSDAPNNERRWVCGGGVALCGPGMPHLDSRGCGYVDAAPVPSPVPSRPDTAEELRSLASFMENDDDAALCHTAADLLDAQSAADQGPDLSELRAAWRAERAAADLFLADPNAYTAARNDLYATLARLLDREGGS